MKKEILLILFVAIVFLVSSLLSLKSSFGIFEWPVVFLEQIFSSAAWETKSFTTFLMDLPKIYNQNRELQVELVSLEPLKVKNKELEDQNKELKSQLGEKATAAKTLISALILGNLQEGGDSSFVLDKGKTDKINVGQPVIRSKVLLGLVEKVSDHQSWVLPLTSTQSSLTVNVYDANGNYKTQGLIIGQYNLGLSLDKILPDVNLQKGDLILSSGLDGKSPAGFMIGQIEEVIKKDNQIFQQAKVSPALNFSDLKSVFIIIN